MRIGLVSGEYPPMEGGVGAFTRELAKEFSKSGNEVHVITSRLARPAVDDRSIWDIREPYDIDYAQLHARIGRWWWSSMSIIAQIVDRFDLDIINVQYQAAAFDMNVPAINFLPWRLHEMTKVVVTFHDLRVPYLFPKAGRLRWKMVHRLARTADGVVVTNLEDFERLAQAEEIEIPIVQLPIGSNIQARQPTSAEIEEVRGSILRQKDETLLGYFGFLNESKGADTLVEALSNLPDRYELIFIGGQTGSSDSSRNKEFLDNLNQHIKTLDLQNRIHWSGFLSEAEVSKYLCACDLMVLPYKDGASLRRGTLMAALAHGCPIITTRPTSAVDQLVHGENVWMTRVNDPEELAEAIVNLAADADLRTKLSTGAKKTSVQFGWPDIAAKTESFFEEIIASNS